MKCKIKIIEKYDVESNEYWTAYFPAYKECVGGGDTEEEAIKEAKEKLEVYKEYKKKINNG